jgi:hypothetical protein
MSVDKENASLVLFTRDAVFADQKATHTWNNINLESLLEGMYDKYESFNLCLSFAMSMINGINSYGAGTTVNDRNLLIYVSGLPFKAQCYNSGTNRISNQTVMGYLQYPTDTTTSTTSPSFQSFYVATFTKNSPIANITIQLKRMDSTLPTVNNDLPQMVYCFDIYGVEPKTKLIEHRIK